MVGYPQGVKGYRVWIPEDGKCTNSRNVVFDEEKLFNRQKLKEEIKPSKTKKVTFSTNLIRGPSRQEPNAENTGQGGVLPTAEVDDQGGEIPDSEERKSTDGSDSNQETETNEGESR